MSCVFSQEWINLENHISPFVIKTQKIDIPGFPNAFNPSIVRWKDRILMSFRIIPNRSRSFESRIGVVWVNEEFECISMPQLLDLREGLETIPSRAEDARLVVLKDRLFMIYDDNEELRISKGGFRVYVAELDTKEDEIYVLSKECLLRFEGESRAIREKSWVPFVFDNQLFLSYSLTPHKVFFPLLGTESCETVSLSHEPIPWDWGEIRGGTPALQGVLEDGLYLGFFHSSISIPTIHSEGKSVTHYFIGAYVFAPDLPFEILGASVTPLIGPGFYEGTVYQPYWKPIRAVFPCGFIFDADSIWISYGRQDHESWVVQLHRKAFLESLGY